MRRQVFATKAVGVTLIAVLVTASVGCSEPDSRVSRSEVEQLAVVGTGIPHAQRFGPLMFSIPGDPAVPDAGHRFAGVDLDDSVDVEWVLIEKLEGESGRVETADDVIVDDVMQGVLEGLACQEHSAGAGGVVVVGRWIVNGSVDDG